MNISFLESCHIRTTVHQPTPSSWKVSLLATKHCPEILWRPCLGFYSLVSSSTERSSNVTAPMRTSKLSKSLTTSTQLENQLQNVTKQVSCSKEVPWRNSSNTLETGSGRHLSLIWSHWGVWEKAGAGKMALGLKSPFRLNMNTEVQASGSQEKVI